MHGNAPLYVYFYNFLPFGLYHTSTLLTSEKHFKTEKALGVGEYNRYKKVVTANPL